MGFIRGGLLVIVCVTLFISLFVGGILLTLSSSLKYENVQPELVFLLGGVVDEQLNIDDKLNEFLPMIELYCQTNSQYAFSYGENTFMIPCEVMMQGSDAVVELVVNSFVDQYYYAEYDCNFWDCLGEEEIPLFLVSGKARDYWQSKFYLALILSIVLAVLVFLLVQKKTNFFFLAGGLTIVSALPLLWLGKIVSLFPSSSDEAGQYISSIILIFFNQSRSVFVKIIIIGGVFVITGIVLKLFHVGFAISNFFEKIKLGKGSGKTKSNKIVSNKNVKPTKKVKQKSK
jgi:hypothetical protein